MTERHTDYRDMPPSVAAMLRRHDQRAAKIEAWKPGQPTRKLLHQTADTRLIVLTYARFSNEQLARMTKAPGREFRTIRSAARRALAARESS